MVMKLSTPRPGEIPGSQAAGELLVWLGWRGDATDCCGRFRGGKRTGRVLLPVRGREGGGTF